MRPAKLMAALEVAEGEALDYISLFTEAAHRRGVPDNLVQEHLQALQALLMTLLEMREIILGFPADEWAKYELCIDYRVAVMTGLVHRLPELTRGVAQSG